ncbi:alpha/beta fold hydrolase [Streptomyces sp. LaPpAH-108]|uniref:alpha/beta fold hydrolase n=1 Tax=Streptomyces sp. LaPpAH-108 TaxID=1155714 RepID=UPI0009961616|nr:alpha/beta fold hydrolase [Streptomyces sp. LaPpAH-108]
MRLGDHLTYLLDRPAEHPSGSTPLVLVHALGLDRLMWAPVIGRLPADRRIIAYDVRGHGRAAGAPPAPDLHALADDLAQLLDELGIERIGLAGLSMGGAIAQTFAVDHPDRLTDLYLVATAATPQTAYLQRAAEAEEYGVGAQLPTTLDRWFSPAFLAAEFAPVRYARASVHRANLADWCASWRALARLDTRLALSRLGVPTRVIAGGDDPSTPPAMMQDIARAIPGADFVVIPGVRHLISLEAPDRLARLLTPDY